MGRGQERRSWWYLGWSGTRRGRRVLRGGDCNSPRARVGWAKFYENYSPEREIKARRVKVIEFKGYISKIVSADKDWGEEVLNLDRFYLGFVLQSIRL